jgi:hypothetical protein
MRENGVKESWVTRTLPPALEIGWRTPDQPAIGDLLLCEIVQPSLHTRLETPTGARSRLYRGDRLICALGGRYATSLLEGTPEIDGSRADLLSASGVCGRALERSDKTLAPTTLRVLGQATVEGEPLNLRRFALDGAAGRTREPVWVLVVGSAMDSGKTTACTVAIQSLARSGLRVGAAKLTGTASARDLLSFRDAGAEPVFDFLDCGWPSTAGCSGGELAEIAASLLGALRSASVDVAVLEIADGLLQPETAALLAELRIRISAPELIFTARESLAGVAGVQRLASLGFGVTAVSGVLTRSPLARREIELATGTPCVPTAHLGETLVASIGNAPAARRQRAAASA